MATRRPATAARIVRNPDVLNGEPIISGTRISVRSVVLVWRESGGEPGVLDAYPRLTPQDVQDALAFYRTHQAEIDRHIQANLAED